MSSLSQLRSRVNALRRKMALPLAIVRVRRMASDYCHRWFVAESNHETLPDPHPFIQRMGRAGIWLPSFAAARNFLDDCRRAKTAPDPERLVRILLPWSRRYTQSRVIP